MNNLAKRFKTIALYCARSVIVLGVVVLIGWTLDVAILKSVLPGLATMKANTAICFLLAGASLVLVADSRLIQVPYRKAVHLVLAAMVTLIGLLTLCEYIWPVSFGIDQFFFKDTNVASGAPPGRMAIATAIGFVFAGLAILLLDREKWSALSQTAAITGVVIGMLALIGYAYDVSALYGFGAYSSVALHTAAGFVLINLGVILAKPERGMMSVVVSSTAGGVMARQLLPFALIAPFLIGWLRVKGEKHGLYSSEFGVALVASSYVILFATLIWRSAEALRRSDQKRIAAEHSLQQEHSRLDGIIGSAMDAIIVLDEDQRVLKFNPAAEIIFGVKAEEIIGSSLDRFIPASVRHNHVNHIRRFTDEGLTSRSMTSQSDLLALRADGTEFHIEASISKLKLDGKLVFTAILRDVSERHKAVRDIQNLAFNDALTQLPNRRLLDDRLEQAIAACKRSGHYGALMFLDLDNFKPLNDTHGHKAGDLLLVEVARRLTSCVREVDTVARFGGDEFVVVLSELARDKSECTEQANIVAQKIRDALAGTYWLTPGSEGSMKTIVHENVGASIGLVLFNSDSSAEDILKSADKAMYQAKEAGRNQICFYDSMS